jgi:hypothetical protein
MEEAPHSSANVAAKGGRGGGNNGGNAHGRGGRVVALGVA